MTSTDPTGWLLPAAAGGAAVVVLAYARAMGLHHDPRMSPMGL